MRFHNYVYFWQIEENRTQKVLENFKRGSFDFSMNVVKRIAE